MTSLELFLIIVAITTLIGFVVMSVIAQNTENRFDKINRNMADMSSRLYQQIADLKRELSLAKELNKHDTEFIYKLSNENIALKKTIDNLNAQLDRGEK